MKYSQISIIFNKYLFKMIVADKKLQQNFLLKQAICGGALSKVLTLLLVFIFTVQFVCLISNTFFILS